MVSETVTTQILDAALGVLGDRGFSGMTIRSVANAAGVSRPTVYARFKNKVALFRAVIQYIFDAAITDVRASVDAGGPLEVVLAGVLESYFGRLYHQTLMLGQDTDVIGALKDHAQDIVDRANTELNASLVQALEANHAGNIDGVTLDELIDLLTMAPRAFKLPGTTTKQYRQRLHTLARVVAQAIV